MASKHKQYKQAQSQRKTILGVGQKRKDIYGEFDEPVNQAAYVDDTLQDDGYNYL